MMKILMLINSLDIGGAEKAVVSLSDELARRGHFVKIVYLSDPLLVKPENENIELVCLHLNKKIDIFIAYYRLKKIVKDFNPDVVHSHLFPANLLSRLLKLSFSCPKIICTEHSSQISTKKQLIAYRLTDLLTDINTNVSDAAVLSYIEKGAVRKGNMVTVVNGVDTSKFYFDRSVRDTMRSDLLIRDKKVILAVGRLSTPKDYPNLIYAISILKMYRDDFIVLIAGDGPLKEDLINLIKDLSLEDSIRLLGVRNDIKNLMQASDVYVMSSRWEGLPMVLLEAMACERMVVATDCGGIKDLIHDIGTIVPIKDSEALAKALNAALQMSERQRSIIGCRAREHVVRNYSLQSNVEQYLDLYYS